MRRFEMTEGTSSKFWEIEVAGKQYTVRFGRLGTTGQSKVKSFASPADAKREADKLVAEKTKKGYVEIGGKAAPSKAAPSKTPAKAAPAKTPSKVAPAKTPLKPGKPGKFAFTEDHDELFARGYPHLRLLSDEAVSPAVVLREAMKGLTAIDPYFGTTIPRAIATKYLHGYLCGDAYGAETKARVAKADGPVDAALLAAVLEKRCAPSKSVDYGGETYDFRLEEIMLVFEAFLGTEVVAAALVNHLVRARDNTKWWKTWADHDHTEAQRLVEVLGWMRLRMPSKKWAALVAPLRKSKNAKLPRYCARLCALADDAVATDDIGILAQRRDKKGVLAALEEQRQWCDDAQIVYAAGADALLRLATKELPRLAKWHQHQFIAQMGTINAPGTLRIMAALLPSRSAGEAAAEWVRAHVPLAKASLSKIEPAFASAITSLLGGKTAPPSAKVDKKALERELKAIFTGIEATLGAQKGDPKKELDVLEKAFGRYCDIRAALGDETPEAYFTHHFADVTPKWKVSDQTTERWLELAVEAAD